MVWRMRRLRVRAAVTAAALLAVTAAEAAPASASAGAASTATDYAVTCTYIVRTAWSGGFFADVVIVNNGPRIDGWTVRWSFPDPTTILQTWSSLISETDDGRVTATNVSFDAVIESGRTLTFGWSARGMSTAVPTDLSINGMRC